jgi:hypothetical protein
VASILALVLNPKSEIQTGKMTQDIGAETNRKNRGIPKAVCRGFFNSFMPKRLRQLAGFNFGFRAQPEPCRCFGERGRPDRRFRRLAGNTL